MAWQRSGDDGSTYPPLMATRGDLQADARTVNEVAGFVWRLSMLSGAHLTDYVLDIGTIEMIGGPRTDELLRLCVRTKLLTKVRTELGTGYKIVEDPAFIHLRSRAEVEWERQQRNDTRNVSLLIPVLRRDGDNCRWCGVGVVWLGPKTARSGEWDHLKPGEAGTIATIVVACRGCNRARGGDVEQWDSAHDLRPAPTAPRYGTHTAAKLTKNGYPTTPTDDEERLAPAPGADPAPTGVRPATGQDDSTAPAPGPPPESSASLGKVSDSRSDKSPLAGSGRVGPASGSGLDGPGSGPPGPTPAPGRRRRGRRGHRPPPARGES